MKLDLIGSALESFGLEPSGDLAADVHALSGYLRERRRETKERYARCTECGGDSPVQLKACPFCGDAGEVVEPQKSDALPASSSSLSPAAPRRTTIWTHPAELLGCGGLATRTPTGIRCLDELLGGGIAEGRIIVIGGGPGAGKTTLVAQVALSLAREGANVALHELDEPKEGISQRWAMAFGASRSEAERGGPNVEALLREELDRLPGAVERPDEEESIDDVFARFAVAYPAGRRVVIVDSLQTAAHRYIEDGIETARERMNTLMNNLKVLAHDPTSGAAVIVTSELNRAGYRGGRQSEGIDSTATFKESGDIEYGCDAAIVIRNRSGSHDLHEVQVLAKNRLGRPGTFGLRLDRDRATFVEVDDQAARSAGEPDELEQAVIDALREHPGSSGNELIKQKLVRGSRKAILDAIRALRERGTIEDRGTKKKPALYLVDAGVVPGSEVVLTGSENRNPEIGSSGSPPYRGNHQSGTT